MSLLLFVSHTTQAPRRLLAALESIVIFLASCCGLKLELHFPFPSLVDQTKPDHSLLGTFPLNLFHRIAGLIPRPKSYIYRLLSLVDYHSPWRNSHLDRAPSTPRLDPDRRWHSATTSRGIRIRI